MGQNLTERIDLYIGAVVTLMFLAGCFLAVVSIRQRSRERKRFSGSITKTPWSIGK
jgi:hypothetical protein